MKKFMHIIGLLLGLVITISPLQAEEIIPSVEEIVTLANQIAYYSGEDGKSDVTMTIKDSQGRIREREFVIMRRDVEDGGEQQFYVYFKKPSDVRKMVFMVHKNVDKDDDRWLYLPALDLVKRIAASDKRTSFVGSHFYYEDVSGRSIHEDVHELVEVTKDRYVIKNTPKDPASVEFSSYTMWIDRKSYMPLKAEYFDKEGQKYRVVDALNIEYIQGCPVVTKSRVKDLASGGETVTEFKNITCNIGLTDKIFTERYLRRPPSEIKK